MFISTRWLRGLPAAVQEGILEGAYETQVFQHNVYHSYLRDQWGIYPDSPKDTIWQKLNPRFVYLTPKEREAWEAYLSYDKNKAIYDPLIEQFGKVEYEATGRIAHEKSKVEQRRWWKA
jgi:hypothetical protein